jgi:hypothetical protein
MAQITQKRKPAIEDLLDRYCQRGDVDTITISSLPTATQGIHLLLTCPSLHGMQRASEAMSRANDAASGGAAGASNSNNAAGAGDGKGGGGAGGGAGGNAAAAANNAYLSDNNETEEERREKHVVRCGVETVLQLAKFKQANVDTTNSNVMIHAQYSNYLLTQFVAGPLLVTLCAKRQEGRSLGLLAALASEIKAEPVFKAFEAAAHEARVSG